MPRNSFIQMTKLHNVRGRIYYISSPKKQENLYAVYETAFESEIHPSHKSYDLYSVYFALLGAFADRRICS